MVVKGNTAIGNRQTASIIGMPAALYFQVLVSGPIMSFIFIQSCTKRNRLCVMGDVCVLFICGALTLCIPLKCECVCMYLLPQLWPSLFLLYQHAQDLSFYPILFDPLPPPLLLPSLILFTQILHLLFPPPLHHYLLFQGDPLIPFPCSSSSLTRPSLPFSYTLILLLQSAFIVTLFVPTVSPFSCSPPIPFLTALGKLVDLVSPARTQWSPACCPGNNGRSLTNSFLSKEQKEPRLKESRENDFLSHMGNVHQTQK